MGLIRFIKLLGFIGLSTLHRAHKDCKAHRAHRAHGLIEFMGSMKLIDTHSFMGLIGSHKAYKAS